MVFCALRRTALGAFAEPCMHACNVGSGLVTAHLHCNQRDVTPSQRATKGCLSTSHAQTATPPCLATPHHLMRLEPWPNVRLRMFNAPSHSAAFSACRAWVLTLHAGASRAVSSAASNRCPRALTYARKLAMDALRFRTCSRASRCFLVAWSVARSSRVLPPLAITFSTVSGNTSFKAPCTTSRNLGASCMTPVPASTAVGPARPGLPGTRRLEGESMMMVFGPVASWIPAVPSLIAPT